jgi:hypothetical protein
MKSIVLSFHGNSPTHLATLSQITPFLSHPMLRRKCLATRSDVVFFSPCDEVGVSSLKEPSATD